MILALAMPVAAAETDESTAPTWQIDGADCNYLVLAHRSDTEGVPRTGARNSCGYAPEPAPTSTPVGRRHRLA